MAVDALQHGWARLDLNTILSYPEVFDTNRAKFVRLGSLVIVGPDKQHDRVVSASHRLLHHFMGNHDEFAQEVVREIAEAQRERTPIIEVNPLLRRPAFDIHDAGELSIHDPEVFSSSLTARPWPLPAAEVVVFINGASDSYQPVAANSRAFTGDIVQEILGEKAHVETNVS